MGLHHLWRRARHARWHRQARALCPARAPAAAKGFRLQLNPLGDNDDFIVPLLIKQDLKALFSEYYVPDSVQFDSLAEIRGFYEGLSERYSFAVPPAEGVCSRRRCPARARPGGPGLGPAAEPDSALSPFGRRLVAEGRAGERAQRPSLGDRMLPALHRDQSRHGQLRQSADRGARARVRPWARLPATRPHSRLAFRTRPG